MVTINDEYISTTYGMFSRAGDRMVSKMVKGARKDASLPRYLRAEMKKIEAAGHGEVFDTVVRERIIYALNVRNIATSDIDG